MTNYFMKAFYHLILIFTKMWVSLSKLQHLSRDCESLFWNVPFRILSATFSACKVSFCSFRLRVLSFENKTNQWDIYQLHQAPNDSFIQVLLANQNTPQLFCSLQIRYQGIQSSMPRQRDLPSGRRFVGPMPQTLRWPEWFLVVYGWSILIISSKNWTVMQYSHGIQLHARYKLFMVIHLFIISYPLSFRSIYFHQWHHFSSITFQWSTPLFAFE